MKCPDCNGTGKIEKPISMSSMGEVRCDTCEGTGQLEDVDEEIIKRLDRLIELVARIATGGK